MIRRTIITLLFVTLAANAVSATVYFDDGGDHTIDYYVDDTIYVDYVTPDVGTYVQIAQGGSVLNAYAFTDGEISLSGGEVRANFSTSQNATALISAGVIGSSLTPTGNSSVTMTGGTVGNDLLASYNARVFMWGGSVSGAFHAGHNSPTWDTALITLYGTDFAVNGQTVTAGGYASDYASQGTDPWGNPCLTGTLTGTLANGQQVDNAMYIFDAANIVFAPEPATVALLALGGLLTLRRRR